MKKFIRTIVLYATAVLVLSVLITLHSKNDLLTDYRAKMFVSAFHGSDLVVKGEVADERRVVFQNIRRNKGRHFSYIAIGSSRIMPLGKNMGFRNCLNVGVSGATLEDLQQIAGLLGTNGISADTVLIDYNPWYLIPDTDLRYKYFMADERMRHTTGTVFKFNHTVKDILSFVAQYVHKSGLYRKTKPGDLSGNYFIRFTDGSIQEKTYTVSARKQKIDRFVKSLFQMGNLYRLDQNRFDTFAVLVRTFSRDAVVQINLTPFHPRFYAENPNDKRVANVLVSEAWVRKLAGEKVHLTGSFHPDTLQLEDADFTDGLHISRSALMNLYGKKM